MSENIFLTNNLNLIFNDLKNKYGKDALLRVEQMLSFPQPYRHPLQKNAKFIMPGIISKPWHNIHDYPEIAQSVEELKKLYPIIKSEINAIVAKQEKVIESYAHHQLNLPSWKAFYLYKDETPVISNFRFTPITASFLQNTLSNLLCPLGEMHFSILEDGLKIPAHTDLWNFSLNLHFAVDVPASYNIQVGGERKKVKEGRCLLFDYSYENESWSNSKQNCIFLEMDIWNPEITEPEKAALVAMILEIRKLLN